MTTLPTESGMFPLPKLSVTRSGEIASAILRYFWVELPKRELDVKERDYKEGGFRSSFLTIKHEVKEGRPDTLLRHRRPDGSLAKLAPALGCTVDELIIFCANL